MLGGLTAYQIVHVTPASTISEMPLIPTTAVPLLLVLHVTSLAALARAGRSPLPAAEAPAAAVL